MLRGQFLTSPLGAKFGPQGRNLAPRGEIWPPGLKLAPRGEVIAQGCRPSVGPFVRLNIRECSPPGVKEVVNNTLKGQRPPLGAKFTPRGKFKLYKTGLWNRSSHLFFFFFFLNCGQCLYFSFSTHKQCILSHFLTNLIPWRDSNPGLLVPEADAMSTAPRRQGKQFTPTINWSTPPRSMTS
jgi:hypothetical protein